MNYKNNDKHYHERDQYKPFMMLLRQLRVSENHKLRASFHCLNALRASKAHI